MQLITDGFSPLLPNGLLDYYGVPRKITSIVWHDMEGYLAGAIARWNTGAAGAHLCILFDGTVVLTCSLQDAAWHAGTHNHAGQDGYGRTPFWRAHNINPDSVGIEIEGFAATGYTQAQLNAVRRVSNWLTAKYAIPRMHTFDQIAGHHTHSELSSSRGDPGQFFDWNYALRAA